MMKVDVRNKLLTALVAVMIVFAMKPVITYAMYDDSAPKGKYAVKPPVGLTLTYNGKEQIGVLTGEGSNYVSYYGYDVIDYKATDAGTYTATACLWGDFGPQTFVWSDGTTADKKITFTIKKADNPLEIKTKTASVKYKKVKKKAQKLALSRFMTFTGKGHGATTYTKASGHKKIIIDKKSGKAKVKKGLKRGTYKVKINVVSAGDRNYKAITKKVTIKIKVK